MNLEQKPISVLVAMSGGVDSTVAAYLLKSAGHHVKGVYMSLWRQNTQPGTTDQDQLAAQKAADTLGIDLEVLDLKQQFRELIVDRYFKALGDGLTPNPCVFCNRIFKWGILMDIAQSQGFTFLASGHYARLVCDLEGKMTLLKGIDESKDQSYFLSTLDQQTLKHMLLPLGDKQKSAVRKVANELGLQYEHHQESQDLCFLNGDSQESFISDYAPQLMCPGEIIDLHGKVIGAHQGLVFYTIGQRKGLGIAAELPLYVVEKDLQNNQLIVGNASDLPRFGLQAQGVNWIAAMPPDLSRTYMFKIRSAARLAPGKITSCENSEFTVKFSTGLRDITPGQQVAIYDGEICLGGGVIVCSIREE